MAYQTGIADACRAAGLSVVTYSGWTTRGNESFNPRGVVAHHTGPWSTVSGMVRLCIEGRSDLPGPLANVVLDPDGVCHVIAAGRANHAGAGGWKGLSGNSSVFGIEAIHNGSSGTPWPWKQLDAYHRLCAALCRLRSIPADMVCGHKEWAPTRKIDPVRLNMDGFRANVARLLTGGTPTVPDDPNMPNITGPVTFHPLVAEDGKCMGYYIFSTKTGELHSFGPGAEYYGRSEVTA